MVQIWFVMSDISNGGMAGFWIKMRTNNSIMVHDRDYLCVDPLSDLYKWLSFTSHCLINHLWWL